MGPETASWVASGSVATATWGVGEAAVTRGPVGALSPQPEARSTAAKANGTIRPRIQRLRAKLPTQPIPNFSVHPEKRPPEDHVGRELPTGSNLGSSFHAGAESSVGICYRDSRVKNSGVAERLSFGADDDDVTLKGSRGIAVQFHDRLLPLF